MDKDGIGLLHVWAESPSGSPEIQVRVKLTGEQIDAMARKLAEMRAKYGQVA